MYCAALLKSIEDAGVAILTLTEGVQDRELLASRLTRQEVTRQLRELVKAASVMPDEQRLAMPEIGWDGLAATAQPLEGPAGLALDEALLLAVHASVPTALMWLRVYRQQHPAWFEMAAN